MRLCKKCFKWIFDKIVEFHFLQFITIGGFSGGTIYSAKINHILSMNSFWWWCLFVVLFHILAILYSTTSLFDKKITNRGLPNIETNKYISLLNAVRIAFGCIYVSDTSIVCDVKNNKIYLKLNKKRCHWVQKNMNDNIPYIIFEGFDCFKDVKNKQSLEIYFEVNCSRTNEIINKQFIKHNYTIYYKKQNDCKENILNTKDHSLVIEDEKISFRIEINDTEIRKKIDNMKDFYVEIEIFLKSATISF